MQTLKRTFIALGAAALLAAPTYAVAQDPPPRQPPSPATPQTPMPQERAPQPAAEKSMTAKGELVSVDDATKTITIKDDTGAELKFAYDDKTDVSGAKEGVAGLATKAGSKVTVKYTGDGAAKTATKIEVERGGATSPSPSKP